MITTIASEVQFDHKQWFHDIDRWHFYLQSWQPQVEELAREYRRLQKMVELYADELEEFADEVGAHRNRLLADEHRMVQHGRPTALDEQLSKNHQSNASRHGDLYKMHERLQRMQQTLRSGLTMFRPECFHGE